MSLLLDLKLLAETTKGAIRARAFRLANRNNEEYRRKNAERSARLRRERGVKPRSPKPLTPEARTQQLETRWDTAQFPEIHLEADISLPVSVASQLALVGATLHTWRDTGPLQHLLWCILRDPIHASKLLGARSRSLVIRATYASYVELREMPLYLCQGAEKFQDARATVSGLLSESPPYCWDALLSLSELLSSAATVLWTAHYAAEAARVSFLMTVPEDDVRAIAQEAVDSVTQTGKTLKSTVGLDLPLAHLERLGPGRWLSGTLIDFLTMSWNSAACPSDCIVLPIDFASRCKEKKLGKAVDILRKYGVARLEHCETRWVCKGMTRSSIQTLASAIDMYCDEKGWTRIESGEWNDISHATKVPQQLNGVDCGVYTLLFIRHLIHSPHGELRDHDVPDRYLFPADSGRGVDWARIVLLDDVVSIAKAAEEKSQ
ncbi:hypothetical protein GGG16DRAFT_106917 [Schizophyllum commune]